MPRVRDWLDRFRPAGGPGAPSAAGVPTDRHAAASAELAPVFAALAEAGRIAQDARRSAADQAGRLVAGAHEQAMTVVDRAQMGWEQVRAAEEARVRSEASEVPEPAPRGAGTTPAEVAERVATQVRLDVARLANAQRPRGDR